MPPTTVYLQRQDTSNDRMPPATVYLQRRYASSDGISPATVYLQRRYASNDRIPPATGYPQPPYISSGGMPPTTVYLQRQDVSSDDDLQRRYASNDRMPPATGYPQRRYLSSGGMPPATVYLQWPNDRMPPAYCKDCVDVLGRRGRIEKFTDATDTSRSVTSPQKSHNILDKKGSVNVSTSPGRLDERILKSPTMRKEVTVHERVGLKEAGKRAFNSGLQV
ncbi:hypothetical protein L211DRAFT_853880 [Terfezia boudieri ATCC MYA-4762]|uniref:Uncharacterized protein n=1 Tax=Terfezia boudieri ATCC MYA-4762 TaxID=1051890 RepID=A0A3N4LLA1_9PEZI|nr:hypothetical protein L211DRAFT_853880 [Terfezia boudieri ATCC MYA-4762]